MRLQETPQLWLTSEPPCLDNPEAVEKYIRPVLEDSIKYNQDTENLCAVMLNARRRLIGVEVIANGTHDTLLVSPSGVFRSAIVLGAAVIVLIHNHPSGDPTPSESDIKVTRDLIRGGQLLKIEIMDHVIIGKAFQERPKSWCSLRELGYFHSN